MIRHHQICTCDMCRQQNEKTPEGGRIRAEMEVAIIRRLDVVFDDNGIVCLEDQAADHARDMIGLPFNMDMEVRSIKCFSQHKGAA